MRHRRLFSGETRRRGATAVLVSLCLTTMLGTAAVALHAGICWRYRRVSQAAADAAALAAAVELYWGRANDSAMQSGWTTAKANGFNNDGTTNTVTFHIPPLSGDH